MNNNNNNNEEWLNYVSVKKSELEYKLIDNENIKFNITLSDYRVKHRPDDRSYKKSKQLWYMMPRGMAEARIKYKNREICVMKLKGYRKFGYIDDRNWCFDYNKNDIDMYQYVTKENGECFHFTMSKQYNINQNNNNLSIRFLFWGSKNCHLVAPIIIDKNLSILKNKNNIGLNWLNHVKEMYNNSNDRYRFAFILMEQFIITDWKSIDWYQFFPDIERYTACAEACHLDRLHLVNYDKNVICWFGFIDAYNDNNSMTAMAPDKAYNIFNNVGLTTPKECKMVKADEKELKNETEEYFKNIKNCEGAVVYVVLKNGDVPKVYKHKNIEYIKSRAIREKIRSFCTQQQLRKRLNHLHVPISTDEIEEAVRMNMYIQKAVQKNIINKLDLENHYLSVIEKYKNSNEEQKELFINEFKMNDLLKEESNHMHVFVIAAPCPGCGKTRLAVSLKTLLEEFFSYKTIHISQDNSSGKRSKFLNRLNNTFQSQKYNVIIIDKYNSVENRQDYYKYSKMYNISFVYIEVSNDNLELLKSECLKRLLYVRKNQHETLKTSEKSPNDLKRIINTMAANFRSIDDEETFLFDNIIVLNALQPTQMQLKSISEQLPDLISNIPPESTLNKCIASHDNYEAKFKK